MSKYRNSLLTASMRLLVTIGALLTVQLVPLSIAISAPNSPTATTLFARGFDALKEKDAPHAIEFFKAGLKKQPENYQAKFYLGEAYILGGDPAAAKPLFRQLAANAKAGEFATKARSVLEASAPISQPTSTEANAQSGLTMQDADDFLNDVMNRNTARLSADGSTGSFNSIDKWTSNGCDVQVALSGNFFKNIDTKTVSFSWGKISQIIDYSLDITLLGAFDSAGYKWNRGYLVVESDSMRQRIVHAIEILRKTCDNSKF